MEELIGLIVFALIMRLLSAGRRPAPPTARRPGTGADRPPADPAAKSPAGPASAEQVFDLRELLREAFPAQFGPTRPAQTRPRRRDQPPPATEGPVPPVVEARPSLPAERPTIRPVSPRSGFLDLGDPRVAAQAVVLAEIFGAPRCRRAYRPPGAR